MEQVDGVVHGFTCREADHVCECNGLVCGNTCVAGGVCCEDGDCTGVGSGRSGDWDCVGNQCVSATTPQACGQNGQVCQSCPVGQVCSNGTRVFVQKSLYDSFVERLANRAAVIRLGDPFDPETLYTAAELVFRSRVRGQTWEVISPVLTRDDPAKQQAGGSPSSLETSGQEAYNTIHRMVASTVRPGVTVRPLWASLISSAAAASR